MVFLHDRGFALSCSLIAMIFSMNYVRAAGDERQLANAATYFRSACSFDLSEKLFRSSLEELGGKADITPESPFSIVFALPGYLAATYYRQPTKCCISIRDVSFDVAIDRASKSLGLRNPKPIIWGERKGVVFQPVYSNRIVSMDFGRSANKSFSVTNICHSVHPDAEALYLSLGR
jgi:hypothetical protein